MTPYQGSLWRNHGRWWWRVRLPGSQKREAIPLRDPYTGRATPDKSKAEKIAQRIWNEAERAGGLAPERVQGCTVGRLRAMWLEAQTRAEEADTNTSALAPLARRPADSIRASEILQIQDRLAETLAVRTVNRRVRAIASVFAFGASRDLVPAEIAWGIRMIAPVRGETGSFGMPDIIAVRETLAVCTPTLWRMVVLQMLTGLRSGELCQIRRGDIAREGQDLVLTIAKHKTRKTIGTKTLVLGPRAFELLEPLLTKREGEYLFTPAESEAERGRVKECRECYDSRSYYHALEFARTAAGASHWHPHQLRHLASTEIADVMSEQHARAVMGHTTVAMTRGYIHEQRRKAREVAEKMG